MSVGAEVNERLAALAQAGTSPWLDQIRRGLIESGELERLRVEDSLRGVTSNPAIFEKAILGSDDYDTDIEKLANEGLDSRSIYLDIAVRDVQAACDVLRPVWEEHEGADGFVSLEVEPAVAHDHDATREQAKDLWSSVDRPNVMIKIPATEECIPAIEDAIAEGINVNVTLLFSVESYETVAEAYIKGLERRKEAGDSLDVHSVASFFVSRVDSEVDKRLEEVGREDLQGTAAIANAQAAYMSFKKIFLGERFAALREAGAPVQRPLWASTGVKNPKYSETKYVDGLVAPHTVNTMPMATLLAAAEKAQIEGNTADHDPSAALSALEEAGIDMGDVTKKLLNDGIEAFVTPFDKLITGIESSRQAAITGRPPTIEATMPPELEGPVSERVEQAVNDKVASRIWRKDESLWGGPGVPEIGDRLGWLNIADSMLENIGDLKAFVLQARAEGFTHAALLGMGGSSLGPEVLRRSFPGQPDGIRLHVLDSTDPGAVRDLEADLDMEHTLFIVSSKSGGTVETLSHMKYFLERTGGNGDQFVAVTDPGSPLADLARERGFRRVFEADPNIGGRYSVLSYFGLVPAALGGVDVEALLGSAQEAEQNCNHFDSSVSNSGLWMGITMGELARQGRNKLTFVVSPRIAAFGLWAEQLVAESTGKGGRGILPVADEPLGDPESYGDDRVFVYLRDEGEPSDELDKGTQALQSAGQPVLTVTTKGPEDLGRIFFFAEFATAVAGWVLEINPFDQPNVQEAKDNTKAVLESSDPPRVEAGGEDGLRELLGAAKPPHYVAIMGWLAPSEEFDAAMLEFRAAVRDSTKATTTFGYGPRFLHSTGQFHKGGPAEGLFLQVVHDRGEDVDVPDADYTFRELKHAQAAGDFKTLLDHGLPVQRVELEGDDPAAALRALTEKVRAGI